MQQGKEAEKGYLIRAIIDDGEFSFLAFEKPLQFCTAANSAARIIILS